MSTANFYTMENFPLYAKSDKDFYFQPLNEETEVEEKLEIINNDLIFHEISIKSGYYSGSQFYVETIHDDLENIKKRWSNEDCHYQFDLCKSKTVRKFQAEINRINNKILPKIAREYDFEQYYCSARFSNGEVQYQKVKAS